MALWQAHFFQGQLQEIGVDSEITIIKTKGDRIQHLSFDKIEGKGFFTKEIEEALLQGKVDVAIHSHKDLETQSPPGLTVAGVSYREDPSELLLIRHEAVDLSLPYHFKKGAVIGTSSARRKSQILAARPDITIKDIRGNVPTRINKLRSGDFDAILLAHAGVHRLELELDDLHVEKLDPRRFIPAPAQGVLAFQCREDDLETQAVIQQIHHSDVSDAIQIERGILSGFGGGCHIPIGVYAKPHAHGFTVRASFGKDWAKVPNRVRFEAKDKSDALAKFEKIKASGLPKHVLITSSLDDHSYLVNACRAFDCELQSQPMITVNGVPFDADASKVEWVVFSSSNGVKTFFAQEDITTWKGKRFAAAGEATARALSTLGIHPDFAGTESDMEEVAKRLAEEVGGAHALFPGSDRSVASLQSGISTSQVTQVTCYQTVSRPSKVGSFDAYIFTSPSNVEGFFAAGNSIKEDAITIAIGARTGATLLENGFACAVAEIPDESELFALLTA